MIGAMALLLAAAVVGPAAGPVTPAPVRDLVARLQSCAHWAGEEPYDPARGRQIARALRHNRCDTLEADERKLRRLYTNDPATLGLLDQAVEQPD
jgi:hypothetical protein